MMYKDKDGNQYRKSGDTWERLQKGSGWVRHESTAYVTVTAADDAGEFGEIIPPTMEPESTEPEQPKISKQEQELFLHFVDSYQSRNIESAIMAGFDAYSVECCEYAKAMVDELKSRGVL